MQYHKETGIFVSQTKDILHIVDGFPGYVNFYSELTQKFHQKAPGSIWCLAHTHPPHMESLSLEDETTLKAQAQMVFPFPLRMATVTQVDEWLFKTTLYFGMYQSQEDFQVKGGTRTFEIIKEKEKLFYHHKLLPYMSSSDWLLLKAKVQNGFMATWERILIERSYTA